MIRLSEVVGQTGIFHLLSMIEEKPSTFNLSSLYDSMEEAGVKDPDTTHDALITNGIITQYGGYFSLSTIGAKTLLLLKAINGEDIELVYRRLASLYPELRHYELVREGMTLRFIHDLYSKPNFGRVFICSPLIHIGKKNLGRLSQALHWAEEQLGNGNVEMLVLHGAFKGDDEEDKPFKDTLNILRSLGAEIRIYPKNPRLHVKLYIREPRSSGGTLSAAFGSENLTLHRNVELGIWITNDNEMIGNLTREFFEVFNRGNEYK